MAERVTAETLDHLALLFRLNLDRNVARSVSSPIERLFRLLDPIRSLAYLSSMIVILA